MSKNQGTPASPAKSKSAEEAEIEALLEAEAETPPEPQEPPPAPPAAPAVTVAPSAQERADKLLRVGDVKVRCLKDQPLCRLGGRSYNLKKGTELLMNPSHAEELRQSGWIVILK